MKLRDVISKVYQKNWSYTNNFRVEIHPNGNSQLLAENLQFLNLKEELNLHIQSVEIPDFQQSQPIEEYVVDRYRIQLTADQVYRFNINFIDHNNFEIWRSFLRAYELTRENYAEVVKLEIKFFKEDEMDFDGQLPSTHLVTFKDCIIENVGRISLSNEDESTLQKFAVGFKQASYDAIK